MAKKANGTFLRYIGESPTVAGVVPLPEGWPALNHDEPNDELRAEKLASGKYEILKEPAPAAPPEE